MGNRASTPEDEKPHVNVIGFDGAGKSILINRFVAENSKYLSLSLGSTTWSTKREYSDFLDKYFKSDSPTRKFSDADSPKSGPIQSAMYEDVCFQLRELGGDSNTRSLWSIYSGTAEAIIFVVDATDRPRLGLMLDEVERLSKDPQLYNVPILILANKQDLRKPITLFDLSHRLNLPELLNGRKWKLMPISALEGTGIEAALQWLSAELRSIRNKPHARRSSSDSSVKSASTHKHKLFSD